MKILPLLFLFLSCQSQVLQREASLDEMIGSMLMIGFRGLEVSDTSKIIQDIKKYHIGSIVLFDYDLPSKNPVRNIESPSQLKKLNDDLRKRTSKDLIICVDQEGGKVRRLKQKHTFPKTVSAQFLGQLNDLNKTRLYSDTLAHTLFDAGFNLNLAPVVDLNINPENPVIGKLERSFHSDPIRVSNHARAFIGAHQKRRVGTVLKHFPGHGSSKADSHLGLVDVSKTWLRRELIPYSELIHSNHVDAIMTAHIFIKKYDSIYPATLSKKILQGILRRKLKFEGVIISDDMQMKAITKYFGFAEAIKLGINAGLNLLVFSNNGRDYDLDIAKRAFTIIKELVQDKKIDIEKIKDSYRRINHFRQKISWN